MLRIETRSAPCNEGFRRPIAVAAVVVLLIGPAAAREEKKEDWSKPAEAAAAPIEPAEETTVEFDVGDYVAPPRTITDVAALLAQHEQTNAAELARHREIANAEPPADASDRKLAEFYRKRGIAAGALGWVNKQIDDLERALEFAKRAKINSADIHFALSVAHLFAGNFRKTIEHRKTSISKTARKRSTSLAIRHSGLAQFKAQLGDFKGAEESLKHAKEYLAASNRSRNRTWLPLSRAQVQMGEGNLLKTRGLYKEAEAHLRRGLEIIESDIESGTDAKSASLYSLSDVRVLFKAEFHGFLAFVLVRQERLIEAEIEARNGLTTYLRRFGRESQYTAHQLSGFGRVLMEQARIVEAEQLLREAIAIYQRIGVATESLRLAKARLILAETMALQRHWQEVMAEFATIESALASEPSTFEQFVAGSVTWGLAQIYAGEAAGAVARLRAAYQRKLDQVGLEHIDTAETGGVLAAALAATGQFDEALAIFAEVVPVLTSRAHRSNDEGSTATARDQRLALILEAYLGALADQPAPTDRGDAPAAETAFEIANAARGRAVQRALAASAARAAARDPALSELVRRAQDTGRQTVALYGLLAAITNQPLKDRQAGLEDRLRQRISMLQAARGTLDAEIERGFPDYAQLINPKPPTVAEARQQLRPGEALIATYVGERRSFVWALPKTGDIAFAAVPMGRDDIGFDVAYLRGALDAKAATLGAIPEFDVEVAHELYQALLAPVKDGWLGAENLLVVAHGPLGQLPFALLPTEPAKLPRKEPLLFDGYRAVPWLARSHAVTVLPSVASLVTLRATPRGDAARRAFAGFGDPWFSTEQAASGQGGATVALASRGDLALRSLPIRLRSLPIMDDVDSAELALLPRLPDTADEVLSIALALSADPSKDVFIGAAASETRVKTMDLSDRKVIVFATHGLVSGDLNGLTQPALALSSPAVVGGADDGLLTMGEILGLKLDADWVVLSACNTASGDGAGAEAVSGLGRAFFYAGARALLVSNWLVHSQSAKDLTTDLFRRQAADATLSRAEALRKAMLAMIDDGAYADPATGEALFAYAHPIFWAPFTLVGDGG